MKNKQESSKFRIQLNNPELLSKSLKIIKNFIQEGTLKITNDKICLIELDLTNVAMIIFEMESSLFTEFDIKEDCSISFKLDAFYNVLQNASKSILILESDGNELKITLQGKVKRSYTIQLIDIKDKKEQKVPELKYAFQIKLPSDEFKKQIYECGQVAQSIIFSAKENLFVISAEDTTKIEIENNIISAYNKQISSKYSTEYLKKMALCASLCENVVIEFDKDYPLRLTYRISDILSFTWILAPRVENE